MDIISKIEIKHFRSFDGGKDQPKVKIEGLSDFNVFSGSNDSGKSNVLRALNLFFNNEISPGVPFDRERDFSKIVAKRFDEDVKYRREQEKIRVDQINQNGSSEKPKDLRRSDEVISIKLFFNNFEKQRGLPESFWISKSFSQKNNFTGEHIYQSDLNKAQTTAFIKSFQFEYVPAIKDRNFFNHLFNKLQNYLFEKGDKANKNKFRDSSDNFNNVLTSETEQLFNNFLQSSGVQAGFHVPNTLIDFFRTLSVKTENDVSLFERGDGVQARFIPEILDEISSGKNKNIIWGFEEPENSYEAKNIQKLKEEFQGKYSKKYQIFITTHTKEFLSTQRIYSTKEKNILSSKSSQVQKREQMRNLKSIDKSSGISIYRVWKKNNSSLITKFDEDKKTWDDICDDLGIIYEARIVDELQQKIIIQSKEIKDSKLSIDQQSKVFKEIETDYHLCVGQLQNAQSKIEELTKPILFVEDKYIEIYMISFLKLNGIEFNKDNIEEVFKVNCPFTIRRACGAGSVGGFLSMKTTDGYEDKKIIGLFDYDKEGCENFYQLKKRENWNDIIQGTKRTGFFKKRNGHNCFYSLLLPIPERLDPLTSDIKDGVFTSFVEIENLISQEKLIILNCVDSKSVLDKQYYKIKDTLKSKSVEKFSELPTDDFQDFKPLFDKVYELFQIK